jgi:hypothetical protein
MRFYMLQNIWAVVLFQFLNYKNMSNVTEVLENANIMNMIFRALRST